MVSAEFPFDFATPLNSTEWLAPGLEWMNNIPAAVPLIDPLGMTGMAMPMMIPPSESLVVTSTTEQMLLAMMPIPGSGLISGVGDESLRTQM